MEPPRSRGSGRTALLALFVVLFVGLFVLMVYFMWVYWSGGFGTGYWGGFPMMGGGGWWWMMILPALLFVAFVLFLLLLLAPGATPGSVVVSPILSPPPPGSASDVLSLRYARGEISREQYLLARRDIEGR
ncbi:MAG: hypothetical protein M1144_00770 [Candidatus Thermoplasmatota archaeon]|nr:hypothetical protein [Candidatus Thermoplasmatota archaeon]